MVIKLEHNLTYGNQEVMHVPQNVIFGKYDHATEFIDSMRF